MDAVYSVTNAANPFAATTGIKTVLQVFSGANQPISLVEWGVSFDGVTASAVPATVRLYNSTGTAGTAGNTPTIYQAGGRAITVQATVGANYSAEPGTKQVLEGVYVPQFMGSYAKAYPLGLEPDTDLSGGTVKAIGIDVNVSASVNVIAYIRFTIGG